MGIANSPMLMIANMILIAANGVTVPRVQGRGPVWARAIRLAV